MKTMSLQQTAYLERGSTPQLAPLQAAIDALGFDCKLDSSYTPFKSTEYLPCILNGEESGFEIYFESSAGVLQNFPHLAATVGARDSAITFCWGSAMDECACVLIVSAALAKIFGAVVHYHDDDLLYSAAQLVDEAKAALSSP